MPLPASEIEHLKALRAKNLAMREAPTMPTRAWDNPVDIPAKPSLSVIASRCFTETLNPSDLRYMALALLQASDEICELREMVRLLEERVKALT